MRWFWIACVACLMAGAAWGQVVGNVGIVGIGGIDLRAGECLRVASVSPLSLQKIDCPAKAESKLDTRVCDNAGMCKSESSEPREIPATKNTPKTPWERYTSSGSWCPVPLNGDTSCLVCLNGASYNICPVYSCPSQGSWIQEDSTDGKHWCRKIQ
jgi:hypothetical protein